MTTLQEVIPQLQQGDYMANIDLMDAYLHYPMNPRDRRFLRLIIIKTHYQFKVQPFYHKISSMGIYQVLGGCSRASEKKGNTCLPLLR